jgi:hypothetical protein
MGAPDATRHRDGASLEGGEIDLKRKIDDSEATQQQKRPRTESSPGANSDSVDSPPHGL